MIALACNAMQHDPEKGRWLDVELLIDMVYELGFDAIDFQLDCGFRSREPEYLKGIKDKCHRHGLPIGFLGIGAGFVGQEEAAGGPIGVVLSADERRHRIRVVQEAVDAAVIIGAPLIRLFGGRVPEASPDRDAVWASQVESFQEVCDYAVERGIRIGLHNHPPAQAPTGDDVIRLLTDVGRENFTHILDTGQWFGSPGAYQAGGDSAADFYAFMRQTIPHATYVRAKIYKIDNGYEEWLDYDRIVAILRDANYEGVVSIVYEDQGNRCDHREARRLGLEYLRGLLEATAIWRGQRR